MGAQSNLSAALLLLAAAAASAEQCARPDGWCVHTGSTYALKDCDGDGIADPVCSDPTGGQGGNYGVRQSSYSCYDSWPNGHCNGEYDQLEVSDLEVSHQEVSRESSCQLLRGKTGEYLDRQHVRCNSNELLNSFKVTGCGGDDMKTGFQCLALRHVSNVADRANACEDMHNKDMQYLDRQSVACGSGEALQYFHLTPSGCEGGDFRYEFKCATVGGAGLGQEAVRHNACNALSEKKAHYLDRQDVNCHDGEAMTAFKVVRTGCSGQDMRYEFKCAVILSDACGTQNGDSSACADECGVPNGDGKSCADVCGVPHGDGKSCLDECGEPNGGGSSCMDMCDVPNGNNACFDACGKANGDSSSCEDNCGVPNGNDACYDACGEPHGDSSICKDDCGVVNGQNLCHDACGKANGNSADCKDECGIANGDSSTCEDVCGLPNGDGKSCLDECGEVDGDSSTCKDACGLPNGDSSVCKDECGEIDGDSSTCMDDCGFPNGHNLCHDACGIVDGDSTSCADACGVPKGDSTSCADACGEANGDSSTCADACGVPKGDSTSCTDACGEANGDSSSCMDLCGEANGDGSSCADKCGVPNGNGLSCACADLTKKAYKKCAADLCKEQSEGSHQLIDCDGKAAKNYVKCQAYINDCVDMVPADAKAYKMRQCLKMQKKCIAWGFIDG